MVRRRSKHLVGDDVKALAEEQRLRRAEELLREHGYIPDPKGGDGWVPGPDCKEV